MLFVLAAVDSAALNSEARAVMVAVPALLPSPDPQLVVQEQRQVPEDSHVAEISRELPALYRAVTAIVEASPPITTMFSLAWIETDAMTGAVTAGGGGAFGLLENRCHRLRSLGIGRRWRAPERDVLG